MQLQPIHESAIDLLVSGKRQHEVAKELNISARTLRRWSDDETFVQELTKQHELARKLDQDEAQQLRREHRQLQRLALKQIQTYLADPATPLELRKHCLTLSLRATHFDIAQEWREFMYFDRKKDKAAENEDRIAIRKASYRLDAGTTLIENLHKANPEAFAAMFGAPVPPASSRQAPKRAATRSTADKSGHVASAPSVPGGEAPRSNRTKADKTGHAPYVPHFELDAICAEVVRESSGRSALTPDLEKNQTLVHACVAAGRGAKRARRNREILRQNQARHAA